MKALRLTRSGATQLHQISSLVDVLALLNGGHRRNNITIVLTVHTPPQILLAP